MKTFEAIKDGANFLGEEMDITSIAVRFYSALYRFAVSLTRSETDAADLVQETFLALTQRSHQIRDFSQIKSWLFTTLRREFLRTIRRRKIHYEVEFLPDIHNLPASDLAPWRSLDARIVLDALLQVDEPYQAKRIQRAFFFRKVRTELYTECRSPVGPGLFCRGRLSRELLDGRANRAELE